MSGKHNKGKHTHKLRKLKRMSDERNQDLAKTEKQQETAQQQRQEMALPQAPEITTVPPLDPPSKKPSIFSGIKVTDWCVVGLTLVLAYLSYLQWCTYKSQLEVMRKDMRAWIAVQRGDVTTEAGKPLYFTFTMKNTGKTPATNVLFYSHVQLLANGEQPAFDSQTLPTDHLEYPVMLPNDAPQHRTQRARAVRAGGGLVFESDPLTDLEKAELDGRSVWVALHGRIDYEDTFKVKHWINFCFTSESGPVSTMYKSCVEHNSIDPN